MQGHSGGGKEIKLEEVLQCQFYKYEKKGVFYIPSSTEIMNIDRSTFDEKQNKDTMVVPKDDVAIWDIENEIAKLVKLPTRILPQYQTAGK